MRTLAQAMVATRNPDTSLPAPAMAMRALAMATSLGTMAHLGVQSVTVEEMSMATVALTCLARSEARSLMAIVGGMTTMSMVTQAMVETAVAMALDIRDDVGDEEMM